MQHVDKVFHFLPLFFGTLRDDRRKLPKFMLIMQHIIIPLLIPLIGIVWGFSILFHDNQNEIAQLKYNQSKITSTQEAARNERVEMVRKMDLIIYRLDQMQKSAK